MSDQNTMSKAEISSNIALAILMILVFALVGKTISSVNVFIPGVLFSLFLTNRTIRILNREKTLILDYYIIAICLQILHFAEEYIFDFHVALPALFGSAPYPLNLWILFNLFAYSIFVLGIRVLYTGQSSLMILPVFFVIVGAILNPMAHILICLITFSYFPGLYTSLAYGVLAIVYYRKYKSAFSV